MLIKKKLAKLDSHIVKDVSSAMRVLLQINDSPRMPESIAVLVGEEAVFYHHKCYCTLYDIQVRRSVRIY